MRIYVFQVFVVYTHKTGFFNVGTAHWDSIRECTFTHVTIRSLLQLTAL